MLREHNYSFMLFDVFLLWAVCSLDVVFSVMFMFMSVLIAQCILQGFSEGWCHIFFFCYH